MTKTRSKDDDLQKNLKNVLVVAQCFGLFPATGITEDEVHNLKFNWCSFRVCYSVILALATLFMVVMTFHRLLRSDAIFNNLNPLAFFSCCFIVNVVCLQLSRGWPCFMVYWKRIESSMSCCYDSDANVGKIFSRITCLILLVALVEHLLSNVNSYIQVQIADEDSDPEYRFFYLEYPFIFAYIPYSRPLGVFLKIISVVNTFAWNFIDLFIILLSTALAEKFRQVNIRVKRACYSKEKSIAYWMSIREDFNSLCKLCRRLDSEISNVILTSFGNNLFFILVQLYKSLKTRDTVIESVYFFFSFGLLLARTVAVCLYTSRVNDESKKSLRYMYSVPSSVYNQEMHRLIQQIHIEDLALTGKRFFRITRGLIFRIAGTIVTYELFLLQFNVNINK